jgi:uncharacterized protein
MPRPRLCRRVASEPQVAYFKPAGVRMHDLEEVVLQVDEYEAVRLKDLEGQEQDICAANMSISQPTFHRLLISARKKVAESIVFGKALRIVGGHFRTAGMRRCHRRGKHEDCGCK